MMGWGGMGWGGALIQLKSTITIRARTKKINDARAVLILLNRTLIELVGALDKIS